MQPARLVERRHQSRDDSGRQREERRLDEQRGDRSTSRTMRGWTPARWTRMPRSAKVVATRAPAGGGEDHRLGQQRADDPAAARAERGANRDLVLARGPLRDHQDRDVGARDQQRQHHRRSQDIRQQQRHRGAERCAFDAVRRQPPLALGGRQASRSASSAGWNAAPSGWGSLRTAAPRPAAGRRRSAASASSGTQIVASVSANQNTCGITPTIVCGSPSIQIVLPIASGLSWNRPNQTRRLSTAGFAAPAEAARLQTSGRPRADAEHVEQVG